MGVKEGIPETRSSERPIWVGGSRRGNFIGWVVEGVHLAG